MKRQKYKIKQGNITYNLLEWLCNERIGIFVTIELVSVSPFTLRPLKFKKTVRSIHYFWKPTKVIVDKKAFVYTEYGKKSDPFTNMWFEIKGSIYFKYLQQKWKLGLIFKGLDRGVMQCKQENWINILNKIEFDVVRAPF